MHKPAQLFDREREWATLAEYATSGASGATLGLVYGRRRQGKTLLLELLAQATGGFMFAATQQTERQNLTDLGAAYASFLGLRQPLVFDTWSDAIDELLRAGESAAVPIIIDEFPYLVSATPGLPSYLQRALSPMGHAKQHTRTRIILCGSALTVMSQLLSGSAPLRGRAALELVVRPFSYRAAAEFWGVAHNPDLAFRLHAVVGGTPAYREMCRDDSPSSLDQFPAWVARHLLDPSSAMFREGGLVLREEPSITDPTSYSAMLAALSAGNTRRSEIASALGRPATSLSHLLSGLTDIGLVEQVDDALRTKRTSFRITEPVTRFHQLLVTRHEPELVAGRASEVWSANLDTVWSKIFGPHFEEVARQWCFHHADPASLGGTAGSVLPTELACRSHRQGHELDVVVLERSPSSDNRVAAIGEAKYRRDAVGVPQLKRLEHLRSLLPPAKVEALPKLLLFSGSGFANDLRDIARGRDDIELVDIERLYHGS